MQLQYLDFVVTYFNLKMYSHWHHHRSSTTQASLLKTACCHLFNSRRTTVIISVVMFTFLSCRGTCRCKAPHCWRLFFFCGTIWKFNGIAFIHFSVFETLIKLETSWGLWRFWITENVSKLCTVLVLIFDTCVLQYDFSQLCEERSWFLFFKSKMSIKKVKAVQRKSHYE